MPNPVVHFEVLGRDPERLRTFYADAFGWEIEVIPGGYGLVGTEEHTHDEAGGTTYTGGDAHMNEGVTVEDSGGTPTWRFASEERTRYFAPGIGGGIGAGGPAVSFSIEVPDLAVALARVEELGGKTVQPITMINEYVTVARFADIEGNVIGLIAAA